MIFAEKEVEISKGSQRLTTKQKLRPKVVKPKSKIRGLKAHFAGARHHQHEAF